MLLNLTGHSVVGFGYDDATGTVYLNDTWDYDAHAMTWTGSYEGMTLRSVSIVNLLPPELPAVAGLVLGVPDTTYVVVTWTPVDGADHYEFWATAGSPYLIPGEDCDEPGEASCAQVAGASFVCEPSAGATGPYTFAVRAVSGGGDVSGGPHAHAGVFRYALAPGG